MFGDKKSLKEFLIAKGIRAEEVQMIEDYVFGSDIHSVTEGSLTPEFIEKTIKETRGLEVANFNLTVNIHKLIIQENDFESISRQLDIFSYFGKELFQKVIINIVGYEDTIKENYEIKEVKDFFKRVYMTEPKWLYFINMEEMGNEVYAMLSTSINISRIYPFRVSVSYKVDKDEMRHISNRLKAYGLKKLKDDRVLPLLEHIDKTYLGR